MRTMASLARLDLPPAELASMAADLDRILGHFQAIQAVDTEGVEPLTHVLAAHGEPGADAVVRFPAARDTLTGATSHAREGFFVVPRVLDDAPPADDDGSLDADPADELDS